MTDLRELLKEIRQWDALDIPDTDGAYWKKRIDAALEQSEQEDKCPTCGSDCNERDELHKAECEIERLRAIPEQEPVVVSAEALDLISEAAEVLDKVRVSCDAWEKYGLRDYLPDELTGTAGMLRDGSALVHPPRRER